MRLEFRRSLIDWDDDGNVTDYGWHVTIYIRGKHRARWHSTKNTTRKWPGFSRGGDENCNRSVTVMLWPLGHLDVWWEPNWRTNEDGMCDDCLNWAERT
jgi:hypothetical protein